MTTTSATRPIPAATANAPSFLFRFARRWRCSCSLHASRSGSVCLVTISKTSLSSSTATSRGSEYGSALRGEGSHGRGPDAHDPRGLLGAVAVHVEQDEGGALARREREQHLPDILPEVDLVVRVCRRGGSHQPPRGPACGARSHPRPVQRHAEEVGTRVVDRLTRSQRSHTFRKASCISSAASARFPVTKYRSLRSPPCSSAKKAAKSSGSSFAMGSRTTAPSACMSR